MSLLLGYAFKSSVGVMNATDTALQYLGWGGYTITIEDVIKGLPNEVIEEIMDPDVGIPLQLNIDGLNATKHISLYAKIQEFLLLRMNLEGRIGIKQAIIKNPDIVNTPIKRPVFIIGFPRTGTTLLFNLLAQDPQFTAPMLWEIFTPFPEGRPENWRECYRYKKCAAFIASRQWIGNGEFDTAHLFRADLPEECLFMLRLSFFIYYNFMRLPSYDKFADWFYGMDFAHRVRMYQFYKKNLQCIGYGGMDNKTYLLKAHVHLMALDSLLEVFPDACLVFTKRPIVNTLGSFCSMVHKGTGVWGKPDKDYGARGMKLLSEFANRSVKVMQKYDSMPSGKTPILDVDYKELVTNPIEAVKTIYNYFDMELSDEAEDAMLDYMKQNPQHKHGKHSYSLEEYGISQEPIEEMFKPYLDYYRAKGHTNLI